MSPLTTRTIHITEALDQAIRTKIVQLEAIPVRQASEEGQLIAYREVLRLAHGGLKE